MLLAACALAATLASGGEISGALRFVTDLQDGARVWTGRVPATGDYLIDVVRPLPNGDAVVTYWLTITVR